LALPLLGILVLPFGDGYGRMSFKRVFMSVALLAVVVSTGALLGCGGSATAPAAPTQPMNYTITVTATSGGVSRSTALTLTVR
jgi:hypothetical protein